MKPYLVFVFTVLTTTLYGQNLKNIKTLDDAEKFIEKFPKLKGEILYLNSSHDSSILDKKMLKQGRGSIFTIANYSYKIIDDTIKSFYRASYIFLDATKLSLSQIDSIRQLILLKCKSGFAFSDLVNQYTMDGNPKHGDTDFFPEGRMMKEFELAVKHHTVSDIFTVDIHSNQWYYVVKKTYEDKNERDLTVLKVKSSR